MLFYSAAVHLVSEEFKLWPREQKRQNLVELVSIKVGMIQNFFDVPNVIVKNFT